MTYWTEFPLVPRIPHEPDVGRARRMNVIATLVILLLGLGLAVSPRAAAPPPSDFAMHGD